MSFIADRVYQTAANPGSGSVTPNASVTGYQTFSSGIPNGSMLTIAIESQTPGDWEICDSVWNGTTLTRGSLGSSSTGSRVTFTGPVNVFCIASAKYINTPAGHADALGFKSTSSTALATTGASGAAGTATITFATQGSAPYAIGSFIGVTGITPTGYNGLYQVTGCTTSSVSYANATTAAQTVAGLITQTVLLTNTSSFHQYVTSTSTQSSFALPDTSTLQQGWSFRINNGSSGSSCTVYTSTGSGTTTIVSGVTYYFTCIDTTVNTAAAWRVGVTETPGVTGTSGNMVLSVSPTITGSMQFTGSTTSAANFGTAITTGVITIGGTTGTGLINIGRATTSQPIQIGFGATATSTVASGTTSSIATTVLTVGGTVTGTFSIGMALSGTNVLPGTYIISLGTGTGGAGTYNLNQTQTVASTTITGTTQKSIDIGTGGASGSITAITLGSSTSGATSTTSVNGTLNSGFNNANYVQVTGAATAGTPVISAQGSDANVGLSLTSKGTQSIFINQGSNTASGLVLSNAATAGNSARLFFQSSGGNSSISNTGGNRIGFFTAAAIGTSSGVEQARVVHVASGVNYLTLVGSITTAAPVLSVDGSDTNIDLALTPKGTGSVVVNSPIRIDTHLVIDTVTATTSATTANQVLATFDATLYRTIKLTVQAADGTNYHSTELLAVHNGTTVNHTEYGTVTVGTACASYNVDYSGATVRLLATPASATATTYRIAAYLTRV